MADRKMDNREWAVWALLGDPYARVPPIMEPQVDRVVQAIVGATAKLQKELDDVVALFEDEVLNDELGQKLRRALGG